VSSLQRLSFFFLFFFFFTCSRLSADAEAGRHPSPASSAKAPGIDHVSSRLWTSEGTHIRSNLTSIILTQKRCPCLQPWRRDAPFRVSISLHLPGGDVMMARLPEGARECINHGGDGTPASMAPSSTFTRAVSLKAFSAPHGAESGSASFRSGAQANRAVTSPCHREKAGVPKFRDGETNHPRLPSSPTQSPGFAPSCTRYPGRRMKRNAPRSVSGGGQPRVLGDVWWKQFCQACPPSQTRFAESYRPVEPCGAAQSVGHITCCSNAGV
jgi:hypothetical protein